MSWTDLASALGSPLLVELVQPNTGGTDGPVPTLAVLVSLPRFWERRSAHPDASWLSDAETEHPGPEFGLPAAAGTQSAFLSLLLKRSLL